MANLKDIRDRIKSVKSIQKVTKAMKMVAAAKMRRAQERMEQARPYSNSLAEVIEHLLPDIDKSRLPLLNLREINRKAYIVVCADRGLAGAFNTNLLKIAQKEIDDFGRDHVDIFCIGKKARDYFAYRNYNIIESHVDFWAEMEFENAMMIGRSAIDHFTNALVDEEKLAVSSTLKPPLVLPLSVSGSTPILPNSTTLPMLAKVTNSILSVNEGDGWPCVPPKRTPRVCDAAPFLLSLSLCVPSPKSTAFPCVAIVMNSITLLLPCSASGAYV